MYPETRLRPGRSPLPGKQRVPDDIRLDGRNHMVVRSETQIRYAKCHRTPSESAWCVMYYVMFRVL
jgi:hypothetical protein